MTPTFGYTFSGNYVDGYSATVTDFHGAELFQTLVFKSRETARSVVTDCIEGLYASTTATFRVVRKVVTAQPDGIGGTYYRAEYVADAAGEWIEKNYGNRCLSYRMAADCNPRAVARLRAIQEVPA